jgi:4'-phosphopantetheinyl transferase
MRPKLPNRGDIGAGAQMLWSTPPRALAAADVALTIAGLSEIALGPALALLSKAELARIQRITSSDYRLQVIKARALLRLMLARYTGRSPRSFEFDEEGGARPQLRDNPWGWHFSVSHSEDRIAVALSRAPIGIDIERIAAGQDWRAIASICFHPSEQKLLQVGDGSTARETFFEIWTRKEAYLKAIGTGLDTDPNSFSIAAPDGAVSADGSNLLPRTWYTRIVDAHAGYKCALASQWPSPRLILCPLDGTSADRAASRTGPAQRRMSPECKPSVGRGAGRLERGSVRFGSPTPQACRSGPDPMDRGHFFAAHESDRGSGRVSRLRQTLGASGGRRHSFGKRSQRPRFAEAGSVSTSRQASSTEMGRTTALGPRSRWNARMV